jgi:hypothetical protein
VFIPLTATTENDWPSILVVGDTASVFYILGLLSPQRLNVFIADTGVDSTMPLRFRRGVKSAPDVAAAYYDFFDSAERIGAGIIRRMDLVIYAAGRSYFSEWCRRFRVPAVYMRRRPDGVILEVEGSLPESPELECTLPECAGCHGPGMRECGLPLDEMPCNRSAGYTGRLIDETLCQIIMRAVDAASTGYTATYSIIVLEQDGSEHLYPACEKTLPETVEPAETSLSAWDAVDTVLEPGESLTIGMGDVEPVRVTAGHGSPKLVEFGVPELHVLKIEGPSGSRYIELDGDVRRVFDGVL